MIARDEDMVRSLERQAQLNDSRERAGSFSGPVGGGGRGSYKNGGSASVGVKREEEQAKRVYSWRVMEEVVDSMSPVCVVQRKKGSYAKVGMGAGKGRTRACASDARWSVTSLV